MLFPSFFKLCLPGIWFSSLVAHVFFSRLPGFGDGKYVSFEERQWHQPCFKCSRCSVSLVGSGFFPDRDQILCTDCNNDDWPTLATPAAHITQQQQQRGATPQHGAQTGVPLGVEPMQSSEFTSQISHQHIQMFVWICRNILMYVFDLFLKRNVLHTKD